MGVNEELNRLERERAEAASRQNCWDARRAAEATTQQKIKLQLDRLRDWLFANRFPFTGRERHERLRLKEGLFRSRTYVEVTEGAMYWGVEEYGPWESNLYDSISSRPRLWFINVYADTRVEAYGQQRSGFDELSLHPQEKTYDPITLEQVERGIAMMVDQFRRKGIDARWPYPD